MAPTIYILCLFYCEALASWLIIDRHRIESHASRQLIKFHHLLCFCSIELLPKWNVYPFKIGTDYDCVTVNVSAKLKSYASRNVFRLHRITVAYCTLRLVVALFTTFIVKRAHFKCMFCLVLLHLSCKFLLHRHKEREASVCFCYIFFFSPFFSAILPPLFSSSILSTKCKLIVLSAFFYGAMSKCHSLFFALEIRYIYAVYGGVTNHSYDSIHLPR